MSCCCCFPPSAKVLTTSGYVRIADLKPSHVLLTKIRCGTGLAKTALCTYLHYDPSLNAVFLVFTCDNGAELIISEKHLLFKKTGAKTKKSEAVAVHAKDVSVGDHLIFVDDSCAADVSTVTATVTSIETRTIQGVYAPLTGKGTLIVDGFHVSCYAEVGSHALAHAATIPLRAWCRRTGKPATEKQVEVEGVHAYAKVLAAIAGIKT